MVIRPTTDEELLALRETMFGAILALLEAATELHQAELDAETIDNETESIVWERDIISVEMSIPAINEVVFRVQVPADDVIARRG